MSITFILERDYYILIFICHITLLCSADFFSTKYVEKFRSIRDMKQEDEKSSELFYLEPHSLSFHENLELIYLRIRMQTLIFAKENFKLLRCVFIYM